MNHIATGLKELTSVISSPVPALPAPALQLIVWETKMLVTLWKTNVVADIVLRARAHIGAKETEEKDNERASAINI